MSKPKKDGIAEMLAAGRACGAIIRGSDAYRYDEKHRSEVMPNPFDGRNAEQVEADDRKVLKQKREYAKQMKALQREQGAMKKSGTMRPVASTPIRQWKATQDQEGADCFNKENAMDTLRRIGTAYEGE